MMAVGLSHQKAMEYLGTCDTVQVACINSPQSVTLSGDRAVLVSLEERIKQDGHFARLLAVDAAYHSIYMGPVGVVYRTLLEENCDFDCAAQPKASMFSSVTGKASDATVALAQYWERNMVSPLRTSWKTLYHRTAYKPDEVQQRQQHRGSKDRGRSAQLSLEPFGQILA
jgi:acyl transferase domain-containing protein